jgi:diguanylate cyclase (GGDEF)-like protein
MRRASRARDRGSQGQRSPALLALIYGAFLAIVGVTASAEAMLVSAHLTTASLESVVNDDTALVRILVNGTLTPADLEAEVLTPERRTELTAKLATVVTQGGMLRVEVRSSGGTALFGSDDRSLPVISAPDYAQAAGGSSAASIVAAPVDDYGTPQVLAEHLPIISGGEVLAVIVVSRDAVPILASIEAVRRDVVLVTLAAALIVAVLLFLIFRSAHRRLGRQTQALLEATRHDPLTGSLNHGALVIELAARLEAARRAGGSVGVGLIDIDGFRLLNDTHGHLAGDEVLLTVFEHLGDVVPGDSIVGRYGPDEFLVIGAEVEPSALERVLEQLRAALSAVSLQFEASEPLPVTVSAGVCAFPGDAASVTELLSVGATTLREAKTSGGDAIRVANADLDPRSIVNSFDVLRGLVIAVDTKDHYTKRHSEDVARYAARIADALGLDPALRRALHLAALLHDVGKIGIPDSLLRKPAKLTAEEYEAFQQHVALGDMIVHDVPGIELVRAGIRHHHERWDGRGYLDGLAGPDIPLIARILAVADAFSAMTTTRPYRKALAVDEAIRRLRDAAGAQLDPDLVRLFVETVRPIDPAIEVELPAWRSRIWSPIDQVA